MSELVILKIGGGSVTFKSENIRKAKVNVIRRIAREIKKAKEGKDFRLVVVHGAGSFGHKLVADYGIKDGVRTEREVEGFVRTQNSMKDLNKVFMDIFREEGLLGFPVQTSACIIQDNKRIDSFDTAVIERLLEMSKDIIPILYGDMVIDKSLGASVVSGDAIVPYLAKKLGASRVLMGTDVDGIFTAEPKLNPDAKLITSIGPGNFESVMGSVGGATAVDVTQGMRGKLMEIREKMSGVDVLVFNITKQGNTFRALSGEKIKGTEIKI